LSSLAENDLEWSIAVAAPLSIGGGWQ